MDIEKCYEFSLLKEKVGKVAQQSKSLDREDSSQNFLLNFFLQVYNGFILRKYNYRENVPYYLCLTNLAT